MEFPLGNRNIGKETSAVYALSLGSAPSSGTSNSDPSLRFKHLTLLLDPPSVPSSFRPLSASVLAPRSVASRLQEDLAFPIYYVSVTGLGLVQTSWPLASYKVRIPNY